MNHVAKRSEGFTLIELMLAMTFIAALLLAIAMTIIQIGTIYNKGTVLKEINQSGRSIGDDVKRTAAGSPSIVLATDYVTNSAGGRLCFGTYSYIWNTAYAIEHGDANVTKYQSAPTNVVHLVKVSDIAKIYCAKNSTGVLTYKTIRTADTASAQELLPAGDHSLGINQFALPANQTVSDSTTGQSLYNLQYAIGSGSTNAMTSNQLACLAPGQANSDIDYCSVHQFSLVFRAGDKVN
jgi:hypothetical protein